VHLMTELYLAAIGQTILCKELAGCRGVEHVPHSVALSSEERLSMQTVHCDISYSF
jgi:hypothetical protein